MATKQDPNRKTVSRGKQKIVEATMETDLHYRSSSRRERSPRDVDYPQRGLVLSCVYDVLGCFYLYMTTGREITTYNAFPESRTS